MLFFMKKIKKPGSGIVNLNVYFWFDSRHWLMLIVKFLFILVNAVTLRRIFTILFNIAFLSLLIVFFS